MNPVKRDDDNFTYLGPTPEVGDLPCRREDGVVYSHWTPSEEELRILRNGGVIELAIHGEPIPPVAVNVVL